MLHRIIVLFIARNREFLRDRSALAWNMLFPFFIIAGFSMFFSNDSQSLYKIGVIDGKISSFAELKDFTALKHVSFIEFESDEAAMNKLLHHRIDLLISVNMRAYWSSSTSPRGYVAERMMLSTWSKDNNPLAKRSVKGIEVPYVEWLFPGILAMNIMFSALFGVGYVIIRYRKNGVLKRMSVTPLHPWEFLTAQFLSRMYLFIVTTAIVFGSCVYIFNFHIKGPIGALVLVFALGGFSLITLSLLVASRSSSEEFAGGMLNLISWPMMFASEVWFSLEGAKPWIKQAAKIFPLTHMIDALRKIMNDGAGFYEVRYHIIILTVMSVVFMTAGSILLKWKKD
jgi:ABC-type multidrug transport system permease subunit